MKNKNLIIGVIILSFILLFLGGFSMMGFGGYSYGMMGMMYGYSSWMLVFNWIYWILLIIALVLLIIWLVKQIQK